MPVPSSAIARLRPARARTVPARRPARRFVTRPAIVLATRDRAAESAAKGAAKGARNRLRRYSTWTWTLYSRWQWSLATARAERVRRRSRSAWR